MATWRRRLAPFCAMFPFSMNYLHWSLQKWSHLLNIAQADEVKNVKDTYSVYCSMYIVKLVQQVLQNAPHSELNVFDCCLLLRIRRSDLVPPTASDGNVLDRYYLVGIMNVRIICLVQLSLYVYMFYWLFEVRIC